MINQEKIEKLLGRSLTDSEKSGFSMFLAVSIAKLEQIIGSPLQPVAEKRFSTARSGYRTVYTDIFRKLKSIKKADGTMVKAVPSCNGKLSTSWFNQVILDKPMINCDCQATNLEIEADWGFEELPDDLALVLAMIFDNIANSSRELAESKVESKRVEDFSVTFVQNKTINDHISSLFETTINHYKSQFKGELQ